MKILGYVNPDTNVGKSKPQYPVKHGGVIAIVGTAPCWEQDLTALRSKFGAVDLCAVNEAVKLINADHIATSHDGRIDMFLSQHQVRWGYQDKLPDLHYRSPQFARVHPLAYAWDVTVGAGSAPFAAAVMTMIGYDLAVFCGCPMDGGGGYAPGVGETHKSTLDDPRFGFIDPKHALTQTWKVALRHMPERIPELCAKWRSMSGYTKHIFGGL